MKTLIVVVLSLLLGACAAKPTNPGAERVYVSHEKPPAGCRFLGEVYGSQGNFFTAEFTRDRNLLHGARNEMRNQALVLGANYIMIETESHSNNTADYSLGGTFSSTVIGNAFDCPNQLLGKN